MRFRAKLSTLISAASSLLIFAFALPVFAQSDNQYLKGMVVDSARLPIRDASVEIAISGHTAACATDSTGAFKCELESTEKFEITIRADGFLILRQTIENIQDYKEILVFELVPRPIREEVDVTVLKASTSLEGTPASVDVIERHEIARTASTSVDDVLRQSVGFSLFRRSGSQTANPTTQGASLRGINSSGASRSQVLLDSIPLNDPFGGWIVWSRLPKISLQRIELLRGSSSALFGSGSIGGTVDITPRKMTADGFDLSAELSLGPINTVDASAYSGYKKAGWSFDGVLSTFQTKGYKIVEKASRGKVDDYANSRNTNFSLSAGRDFGKDGRVFARASVFGEGRNNGTPAQKNRTHSRDLTIGTELNFGIFDESARNSRLVLRAFGSTQVFDQTFSAIFGDRSGETLVRLQRVPAQRTGFLSHFFSLVRGHSVVVGLEGTEIRGSSNETGFFGGIPTSKIGSGGRERKYGLFFQDFARIGEKITVAGALRYDHWKNFRALSSLLNISSNSVATEVFENRTEDALSPSISMLYSIGGSFSVYALAGRSFRSPTLNELYRGFRVGSVITNPNALLRAETAWNTEGGARFSGRSVFLRANLFRTVVSNAIANVTVNPGPPVILRERRNSGETTATGFEAEADFNSERFDLSAGFIFIDASVSRSDSDAQLVGLRVPQVPKLQLTLQAAVRPGTGWLIAFQGRAASGQFDDDANTFLLERYFTGDIFVSKRVSGRFSVFATVENIFNSRYSIGKTPVRTVSSPIGFRAGMRWN